MDSLNDTNFRNTTDLYEQREDESLDEINKEFEYHCSEVDDDEETKVELTLPVIPITDQIGYIFTYQSDNNNATIAS